MRYSASADTTITNAFKADNITRATGSNMGMANAAQIFSIYGQGSGSGGAFTSVEKSRALTKFPVASIAADRAAGIIPASGSASFHLNIYNARTPFTLPKKFTLLVHPVSRSWDEGYGLDMETYTDVGNANWIVASSASAGITNWTTEGGDYHTGAYVAGSTLPSYSQYFENGTENINIDITALVEEWVASNGSDSRVNHGIGVMLTSSQEDGSEKRSFYTKKFFSRGTEYFYSRPIIEARWDDSKKDDRGNFYTTTGLTTGIMLNNLYLYNYVRGALQDIPGFPEGVDIFVSMHTGTTAPTSPRLSLGLGGGVTAVAGTVCTGTWVATGIYSASMASTSTVSQTPTFFNRFARSSDTVNEYMYDVWHNDSSVALRQYWTGSGFIPIESNALSAAPTYDWVTTITNFKASYKTSETPRFRVFTRPHDWSPNIYTVATTAIAPTILPDAYYRIFRIFDNIEVVPYGTGSVKYTQLSYDTNGNYFDFNMNLLEPGYAYGIKIMSIEGGVETIHPETFKFRVE